MFKSLSFVSKSNTKRMFLYVIILLCQIICVPYIVIVLYTLYWCDHFPYPYGFAILYGSTEINDIWYDMINNAYISYMAFNICSVCPPDKDKGICFWVGNMHDIQFCFLNGDQQRRRCLTAARVLLKHHLCILCTVIMIGRSTVSCWQFV